MAALEFLKSHLWIIPLVLIPLLVLVLHITGKRRRRRKSEEELTRLKRRDEALEEALRNPLIGRKQPVGEEAMEITWDENTVTREQTGADLMAELIELSGYSRRKYVLRTDIPIEIGSSPDNRLSLPRDGIEKYHCTIFMKDEQPCVRSFPGAKTILRRGRVNALVGEEGVYLQNGDRLEIGTSEIQFRLFRA